MTFYFFTFRLVFKIFGVLICENKFKGQQYYEFE